MIKKHIIPFILGIITAFVTWQVLKALLSTLPNDSGLKAIVMIVFPVLAFAAVNNFFAKKFMK